MVNWNAIFAAGELHCYIMCAQAHVRIVTHAWARKRHALIVSHKTESGSSTNRDEAPHVYIFFLSEGGGILNIQYKKNIQRFYDLQNTQVY